MNATKLIGIGLILLGIFGFIFGGISWTETESVEIGELKVEAQHEEGFPITPVASGVAVVAGIVLVVVGYRGTSREKT